MTDLALIAAVSENNVIGFENALPWRIPEDLARFKALTMGHVLVMGRKTYESIGRPLPGRITLVLTRRGDFSVPGVLVARDRQEAVALVGGRDAFIAGGAEIYALFLPLATTLYLTRVHDVYDGDTFFPPFDPREWRLVSEEAHPARSAAPAFTFQTHLRVAPPSPSAEVGD